VQRYPVRATARPQLRPEAIEGLVRAHFGTAARTGDRTEAAFGALARLVVWADGRALAVEMTMNPNVEPALQAETIRRYNQFLEAATGYSSKERARRLRKAAGAGDAPG